MNISRLVLRAAVLSALSGGTPAAAQVPPQLDRLQRADGATVVPDHFLRSWDPVTILFHADTGPAQGGPEDTPDRFATVSPARPGAWTWLGPRTLQFRPTEPWEPLRRETVAVGGRATTLVPLLPVPSATGPADADGGIAGLDTFSLTFDQPVDLAALARLLTIDIRPQAGVTAAASQVLTADDFDLRPIERAARSDRQTILIVLHQPVPDGRVATLHLRLSDEPGLDDPIFSRALHSATPFTATDAYCGDAYDHSVVDGVVHCDPSDAVAAHRRTAVLQFSAMPAGLDIVAARDALRFTPPVADLAVSPRDQNELHVSGDFRPDQVYTLAIAAGALHDARGRPLEAAVTRRFSFGAGAPVLALEAHQGIVERLGPQMMPLHGHGYDHADVRIYPIDPLSRDFWPFPRGGLVTSDDRAPPLPGNEPGHYVEPGPISGDAMAGRIFALGSPAVSEMLALPIRRGGVAAKFGLDLAPALARIAGPQQPGTYLVGLRTVDGSPRQWARIQVTDLSLSVIEEADRIRFVATSLATAQPVEGAEIRLDGILNGDFSTLARGTTGPDGSWTLTAPIGAGDKPALRRIVVSKATDTLVVEPGRGPQQYANGIWSRPDRPWLDWTTSIAATIDRREKPQTLCHVFTERPIYRPEEPILIAGMIRRSLQGRLSTAKGDGQVIVTGPGDQEWRIPVTLDEVGGFHVTFDRKTAATGEYAIRFQPANGQECGDISVQKEAYRLPTFEVLVNGPPEAGPPTFVPLDRPFTVNALARFFAGGMLSDRPIQWRVTQFPYAWTPPGRAGFLFSSDSRFSGENNFRSTPVLSRSAKTDDGGAAALTLDPTVEPTAQPRQYQVEATVTGEDDIQVRAVRRITALPPFVLGVKVPRYIPALGAIDPELLALDGSGKPVVGLAMDVKLVHRQWNSVLQASDFAQGAAKYATQVIDETVEARHVTSTAEPQALHFDVKEAGVYLVEVTASDRVGRSQSLNVDLFVAGDTPVTWQNPPAETVAVSTDRTSYDPGDTATLLIQSPFQTARALAVVEQPEGRFTYDWVDVANGVGRYAVPIRREQTPRLAVHFLLMRGRLPATGATAPSPTAPFDQGKPVTTAATTWLTVNPVDNRVKVSFDAPATARPGQAIDLTLHLADGAGHPLAGEATVWLVDQAVLSLAKEQPLDPLPAFIVDRPSRMVARDTRNMAFGVIPLNEAPGGDEAGDAGLANISVRKNFTPVPFYAPRVMVGPDGTAHLHVVLPDSLTVFMLRAKAISGPDRFGSGSGELRVRQPVVAQPALPRFVRSGDSFDAGLIGRIVEGAGGAGRALLSVSNLAVQGPAAQDFTWEGQRPAHLDTMVSVPEPPPGVTTATLRFTLERLSDHVGDAVQIQLPIEPDRPVVHRRDLLAVGPGGSLEIPALADRARGPSYLRQVTLATDPAAVRLLAGLGVLARPPIGGTGQRMALAQGELALLPFTPLLDAAGLRQRLAADVADAIAAIRLGTDDDGLVAFFPRTRGSVWLTASAYRVLVAAKRAGLAVDAPMMDRMQKVLTAALRSDYPHLMGGEELFERVAALTALADGGQVSPDYAAELARRAAVLRTGSLAEVATVLARLNSRGDQRGDPRLLAEVLATMWGRVNLLARDGKPVYGGLTDSPATEAILPSEARSLARVTEAAATAAPGDPRLPVVRAGLLGLAGGQGWGSTDATAAALQALAASWQAPAGSAPASIAFPDHSAPDRTTPGRLDRDHPLLQADTRRPGPAQVQAPAGTAVLAATDYVPAGPGASAAADQHGFVVTRTLYRVQPMQGATQAPPERIDPSADGAIHLTVGDVVEEVDELVNPEDRAQVALHMPLAAGLEPLNPALATATEAATPSAPPTLAPSWASYADDEVAAVWLQLARGTYSMRTRMQATIPGTYTAPPALAEMLYRLDVNGASAGQRIVVTRP